MAMANATPDLNPKSNNIADLRDNMMQYMQTAGAEWQKRFADDVNRLVQQLERYDIELSIQSRELAATKEALDALRKKYSDEYDRAPVGIFSFADDGIIVDVNATGALMINEQKSSLINRSFFEFIPDQADREHFRSHISIILKASRAECKIRLKRADGTFFIAHLQSVAADDLEQNTIHIRTAVSDITVQENAEAVLRESEIKYRIVADNTYAWEFWIDQEGRFAYVSPSCERITGYAAEEFVRDPSLFTRIIHPDDLPYVSRHLTCIKDKSTVCDMEYRIIRADGEIQWLGHECQPVFDSHGRFLGKRGSNRKITKRKQAESALLQAEAKYHGLFEATTGGIIMIDRNGLIVEANSAATAILGISPETVRGRSARDPRWHAIHEDGSAFPDDDHPSMITLRTGCPVRNVVMGLFRPESGRYCWILINAEPIIGPGSGEVEAAVITFIDITARKEAEDALRINEERFRAVLENSLDASFCRDLLHDRYDYVSPVIERITGFSPLEYVNMGLPGLLDRVHPDDLARLKQSLEESVSGVQTEGLIDFRLKCKNGEYRWISKNFRVIRDSDGRPRYRVGAARDITGQKRAEKALAYKTAEFEAIFNSMSDAAIFTDLQRRPILLNNAATKLFGYSLEEVEGKTTEIFYPDKDSWEKAGTIYISDTGEPGKPLEIQYRRKDGSVFFAETIGTRVKDSSGAVIGLIGIHRDITKRKKTEAALRESEDRYRFLVELSPEAIAVHTGGKYVYMNQTGLKLFGATSPHEILGKNVLDLVHPDYCEIVAAWIKEVKEHGNPTLPRESKILTLDGRTVDVEAMASPIRYGGEPSIQLFLLDITDRKRAETVQASYLKNLEFLSTAAVDLLRPMSLERFFQFVVDKLRALAENAIVVAAENIQKKNSLAVRALSGNAADLNLLSNLLGESPIGLSFTIIPDIVHTLNPGALVKIDGGLYAITRHQFSQDLCKTIEGELPVGDVFLMPFAIGNELLGMVAILSRDRKYPDNHRMIASFIHLATISLKRIKAEETVVQARQQLEDRVRERTRDLNQRVKELNCLYTIHNTLDKQNIPLDEKLSIVAHVISQGLQYPEIACAKVVYGEKIIQSENFRETEWKISNRIPVRGNTAGFVVVCYLEERPNRDEGPFIREERELIEAIASHCGDTIDRTQTDEQIRESRRRLFNTLESITDAFFTLDRDWRFTYVNHAGERLLRKNREILVGQRIWDIAPQMLHTVFDREFHSSIEERMPVSFEAFSPTLGSWVEVRAYPVSEGLTVYLHDITERKKSESRVSTTNEILKLFAQKMTRQEYLAATVKVIKNWSECRHVRIRLFGPGESNSELVCADVYDEYGNTRFVNIQPHQCACMRVILGVPEQADLTSMTPNGSFYTNDLPELLQGWTAEQKALCDQTCPFSRCFSVGCVPIRYQGNLIGIIHLADERAGMVSFDKVEFMEVLAFILGEAVYKFGVEEELRRNYESLKENNNLLESMFSNIRVMIAYLDCQFNFVRVNRAFAESEGREPNFYVGKRYFEIFSNRADRSIFERVLETGEPFYAFARRLTNPEDTENEVTYWDWSLVPMKDEKGIITGLVMSLIDVTERERAEAKLMLFKDLINQSSDAILLIDPETGSLLEVNDGAIDALQYSRQELLSRTLKDISVLQSGPGLWEGHVREIRGRGYVLVEDTLIRKDGRRFPVEVNIKYLTHDDRSYMVAVVRDITDRKQAEMERARLAAAVDAIVEAVVITDTKGIIQYVNPAFEQITGYSRSEAVGQNVHMLDSGKHEDEFYQELRETLARKGVWRGRMIQKKKDSTLYDEDCTYSPVRDDKGNVIYYVSIKRDITERLRLESVAEAVNTMDNIGYIFSGVRHEIGNPINSINMILGILKSKLGGLTKEAIEDYITRMLTQISRVEYLLKNLKSFNMYERLEIRNVHLPTFMQKFLALVREDFTKYTISLELHIGPRSEWVYADPRALQQVLLNILTNAAASLSGRNNPQISISVWKTATMVLVRITDNGCGMNAEQLKNVFKPFYTTKAEGTGLGLVIAKKMLSKMNGVIEITSRVNMGTTVNIFLPEGTACEHE